MPAYALPSFALGLTRSYLDTTLAGDTRQALHLVDEALRSGVGAAELQLRMIVPAQREIGRLWEHNEISVAQEHLATSISQLMMSHLYPHLVRAQGNGKRVTVACVQGEMHDLGARMGADFLETVGFEVHFLGADVASERLRDELVSRPPDLLGLSATLHFHVDALREAVRIARTLKPALPIVVGGGLIERTAGLAAELDVVGSSDGADQLAQVCLRLLAC